MAESKRHRILYVEDDFAFRSFIEEYLHAEGLDCSFTFADDAASVLAALGQGDIDLVLSDFNMPGLDGHDALALVRGHSPDLPFLLFSGALMEADATPGLKDGVTEFVPKDAVHRLAPAIRRALRERVEHSERMGAQEALRTTEHQLSILSDAVRQTPIGIVLTDTRFSVIYCNEHFCQLIRCSEEQLTGPDVFTHWSMANRRDLIAQQRQRLGEQGSWKGEFLLHRTGVGDFPVRATLNTVRDNLGHANHFLMVFEDITQWRREHEHQELLKMQLFQAQKSETIGTLAGGIAHDFNNILTGILGFSQLALLSLDEGESVRAELEEIMKASQRAKSLVSQILTFSRRSQPKAHTPVDLAHIAGEALQLIRATAPSSISLVQHFDSGHVKADATQLHQVVMNLCSNGIHAMKATRGVLEVRIERVLAPLHEGTALTELQGPGPWLRLTVTDTGHGMDELTLSRIFDPFFTTKAVGEGTGLGLSVVQGIIQDHGGAIRVRSVPGEGTCFSLFLPEIQDLRPKLAPETGVPLGGGQRVLVIDDEEVIRSVLERFLMRLNYRVVSFSDVDEARSHLLSETSRVDLLLTDLTMPKQSGLDLLMEARRAGWRNPAIIMSGNIMDVTLQLNERHGQVFVLEKPFENEAVARAVHEMLARR